MVVKILILIQMSKISKAANWLKVIAAILGYVAGLLTGNTEFVSNFLNF